MVLSDRRMGQKAVQSCGEEKKHSPGLLIVAIYAPRKKILLKGVGHILGDGPS
jgi:hypothetical protein